MYEIRSTKQYRKSIKRLSRSGNFNIAELEIIINIITQGKNLPAINDNHFLTGNMKEYQECHIKSDLLLVYQIDESAQLLLLVDIGSHSYLFG